MLVGARRDLRRVGHRDHLHAGGEPRQPRADRVGHRAADAGVDLVEHQRRRRAASRPAPPSAPAGSAQLAARGDLHQRPGPGAGIGLHPELDAVDAVRPGARSASLSTSVDEFRALELERRELAVDRLVRASRRPCVRAADSFVGRGAVVARRPPPRPAPALSSRSAPASISATIGGVVRGQRREVVDRRGVLARRRRAARTAAPRSARARADRNRPRASAGSRCCVGLVERVERGVERLDRRLDQRRRLPARRSSRRTAADSAGTGECCAADRLVRLAQIAGDLLGLHHGGAALGQRGFLAGLAARASSAHRRRGADSRPRARARSISARCAVERLLARRGARPTALPAR